MAKTKIDPKVQAKIDKLEADAKGRVSFGLVGANAFSNNGRNYFKATEFPQDSGNYGYRANIIIDDAYVPLVDAAMKLALEHIKKKDRSAICDKDGNWIHNKSKLCFLDGNLHTYGDDDEVYDGFADKWYLKTNRKDSLKAPRVFNAATREELKSIVTEEGKLILPDGVKEDGSKANFFVTIYPNPEYGSINCSISRVAYRADEFAPLGGGEALDEEDEEDLFSDPEASAFGEDDEDMEIE